MFSHHDARRPSFVPTANAAAALAQLHNSRPENDWDVDPVHASPNSRQVKSILTFHNQEQFPDPMGDQGFPNYFANSESNIFTDAQTGLPSDSKDGHLLPASFPSNSRAASQQPFSRPKQNRPRKSSVTENARKGKHERQRSKDHKRISGDRKTLSAESGALIAAGKRGRWEDLLDAAASATEEDSRDLTPVRPSRPLCLFRSDLRCCRFRNPLAGQSLPSKDKTIPTSFSRITPHHCRILFCHTHLTMLHLSSHRPWRPFLQWRLV